MNTLERQLVDYGTRQRELHGPITPEELAARGSLVPSAVTTDATPPPKATGPPPSALDPVSSYRWSRVPHSDAAFGEGFEQVMSSVTVGGPGLVAVGQAGSAGAKAAVWTSVDGVTWSRVPRDEAVFGA